MLHVLRTVSVPVAKAGGLAKLHYSRLDPQPEYLADRLYLGIVATFWYSDGGESPEFHKSFVEPQTAAMVVVGDIKIHEIDIENASLLLVAVTSNITCRFY